MNNVDYTVAELQVRSLEEQVETGLNDKAAKVLLRLIPEIHKLYGSFDERDYIGKVFRQRISEQVSLLLSKRIYYICRNDLLGYCTEMSPDPSRLQYGVEIGIDSIVCESDEDKEYVSVARQCIEAGAIFNYTGSQYTNVFNGISRLRFDVERHIRYSEKGKRVNQRAADLSEILDGAIKNNVKYAALIHPDYRGRILFDLLCLLGAGAGRIGAEKALQWILTSPELFAAKNSPRDEPVSSSSLIARCIDATHSSNLLYAAQSLDATLYSELFESGAPAISLFQEIMYGDGVLEFDGLRIPDVETKKLIAKTICERFHGGDLLEKNRAESFVRFARSNGIPVNALMGEYNGQSVLDGLVVDLNVERPDFFVSKSDAIEFIETNKANHNGLMLALVAGQSQFISQLMADEKMLKLLSASALYHDDVDIYPMLGLSRDYFSDLEIVIVCRNQNGGIDDIVKKITDERTISSLRRLDIETFEILEKYSPKVFNGDLVRRLNWINPTVKARYFLSDLEI